LETRGVHLLAEFHDCAAGLLDDQPALEALMLRAVEVAGARVVQTVFHRFAPQGVTGVVVVEESHFSIHTWPEHGYAAVDVYTCGDCHPERARDLLQEGLGASRVEWMRVDRGRELPGRALRVAAHEVEGEPEAAPEPGAGGAASARA